MKRLLLSLTTLLITIAFSMGIFPTENVKAAPLEFICKKKDIVITSNDSLTLVYAANELVHFLKLTSSMEVRRGDTQVEVNDWVFRLELDTSMPNGEWKVASPSLKNKQNVVRLIGHDATGVLYAVYTLLEKLGVSFDITGPILPVNIDFRRLAGWSSHVKPKVTLRGIRQHINFPMDISSYPLEEAKEYIRNLARLKMNFIVFHSYKGQFFECPQLGIKAGEFFYGQRHDLPITPLLQNSVSNHRTFCIPEIEAIFDRPDERSHAAVSWLKEVMREAKICGFTVQFSFESPGSSPEDGLAVCQSVLSEYPQTDILEMITAENAGNPAEHLARNLATARLLKAKLGQKCPQLALGVYETGPALKDGLVYLRKNCPPDILWTFLPAHGSRAVVDALKTAGFATNDWRRSVVYSWIEFDGLMYVQQNSVQGTQQLLNMAENSLGGAPIPSIALNHWRTAENRTAIRYFAHACLEQNLTTEAFYKEYAHTLGIADAALYAKAMNDMDNMDAYCREKLFNIGFCFVGCWTSPKGLSWTRVWKKEDLQEALQRISDIRQKLTHVLKGTNKIEGRKYLRFLDNRLQCSTIHLRVVEQLLDMHSICDDNHPDALRVNERKIVKEHCLVAMKLANQYMQLHADAIEDRGCEGTLISYYHTIPVYIKHIEEVFLGGKISNMQPSSISQPPAPGESSK